MEVSNLIEQKTCEEHGEFESNAILHPIDPNKIMMWTGCPQCSEIRQKKEEERKRAEDEQLKLDRINNRLKGAGIPPRFLNKRFNDYIVTTDKQAKVKSHCERYADRFDIALKNGVCLAMIGNSGSGKNHLAMSIANEVVRKKYTAHYVDAYMMLSDVKHAQQSSDERETQAIKNLSLPDLLIIDEVGDQVGSDADKRLLNKIINNRYNDNKPIIILSNLNGNELKQFLGTRITTRFSENSGKILLFDWPNYRGNIKSNLWDD